MVIGDAKCNINHGSIKVCRALFLGIYRGFIGDLYTKICSSIGVFLRSAADLRAAFDFCFAVDFCF